MYICPLLQASKSADDDAKTEGTFMHYILFLAGLEHSWVFSTALNPLCFACPMIPQ